MTLYTPRADLSVAEPIATFAEQSLSGTSLDPDEFWTGVSAIVHDLAPRNSELLRVRADLQARIDDYHRTSPGVPDPAGYRAFLTEIGYLVPEPEPFSVTTTGVDPELAGIAGPQLVVPLLNARFALNAANARWGSLYDALYGTDAIDETGELAPGVDYNPVRGAAVIAYGRAFLDRIAPLTDGSHADATHYAIADGAVTVSLADRTTALADPERFAGYAGPPSDPSSVLLRNNGLHVEIAVDRTGPIGRTDRAGIQDLVLESAITTIMDLEDSVAAVDAEDKALGYHNWRGLMDGSLTEEIADDGSPFVRALNPHREYIAPDGSPLALPGRSVLLVRNVGHLMRTDAVLDRDGEGIYEGILDAIMTALGALPDLRERPENSRTGSVYIVKPKMHGPDEVAFTVELFARVERLLGLPARTLKIGIMDEERRTSANLAACVLEAADRVIFINTGFLDRTGDEIHTSLYAGPFPPKAQIGKRPWFGAYEERNVAIGVAAGLDGRAQIGKGMWARPDRMRDMLEQKIEHVRSGASTAWVPSPTAATLHALHNHEVDAFAARHTLAEPPADSLATMLEIPLAEPADLAADAVAAELDNNVQSILGYVVRWIDQGVGCSKVPDIHGTALMEDRATLRISSQLLANWLTHGVVTEDQVEESLLRLAEVVDEQNSSDTRYVSLLATDPGLALRAARRLILEGAAQPNGYTEPILHALRRERKAGA